MKRPRICAAIVNIDMETVKQIEPAVDLFEVRIDLIGKGWPEVARELKKPWIACNRRREEGGTWQQDERERLDELTRAIELGASIVDIELGTDGLAELVPQFKKRAQCLISHHDFMQTPSLPELNKIVHRQLATGADICKVVTTARVFSDNMVTLQLIREFPQYRVVSFAIGESGTTSRVLCPLVGGDFTYASVASGRESAPGQLTADNLREIYRMVAV